MLRETKQLDDRKWFYLSTSKCVLDMRFLAPPVLVPELERCRTPDQTTTTPTSTPHAPLAWSYSAYILF